MDVEAILTEAFLAEARSKNLTITSSEQTNIKKGLILGRYKGLWMPILKK